MKIITDLTPTPENQEIIYNALDTMQTMGLKETYDAGLIPDWAVPTYQYSEKMLGPILTMMRRGVKVDIATRDIIVADLEDRLRKVRANFDFICETLFGTDINVDSPVQLNTLFYVFLGIPEHTKSFKGETKVSTDRKALELIEKDYIRGKLFAKFVLKIRDLESQIEFLTKSLSPDNRLHTSYNIAGTETFRLSSSEHPLRIGTNKQNIPKHARKCIVADDGYLFFQADQQGAEARIVAYESGDENYIAACEGGDSHTMVASMVFGFEPKRELAERNYYRDYSYRDLTKRGAHGCLAADHEVLTPTGWQSIAHMPKCIAQWNKDTQEITWAAVSNWISKPATDLISIEGASLSSLSTPEHRFIVNADGVLKERTAETLKKSDKIPYTGIYIGGKVSETLARLVAAYQADGNQLEGSGIRFKFRKQRKIQRMRWLLGIAGITYTESVYNKDTVFRLPKFDSDKISKWGKFASALLLQWDAESLSNFVDESIFWDGTQGPSGRQAVCSVNLEHCRWMQTFYQLTGHGSKLIDNSGKTRTNAFGTQRPHWVSKNSRKLASLNCCTISKVTAFACTVYCPTVPDSYFIVRRKNHIYVTGNSNYYGKPYTLAKQMNVETDVAERFQALYFKKFPGISDWHAYKAKLLQTQGWMDSALGIRRNFWGRKWDDATLREAIAYSPQSTVGVLTNIVLYKLWLKYEGQPGAPVQILINGHDAVIGQVRADMADQLLAEILEEARFPFPITDIHGKVREVTIPFDMEVGQNWGKYDPVKNPGGLQKWKPKLG